MNNDDMFPKDSTEDILFNSLNEQGYIFQEACKYELSKSNINWSVKASEYPVSIMGQDTKIDLVLQNNDIFALVECKRADPVYTSWLFAELEPGKRNYSICQVLSIECLSSSSNTTKIINRKIEEKEFDVDAYIAKSFVEVKDHSIHAGNKQINQMNGNSLRRNSNPQNIENAFGQVLRGLSAFALEQLSQRFKSNETFRIFFIPIVVTTASLYLAHYKAQDISLTNGKIDRNNVVFGQQGNSLEKQNWVLVNYGASENIALSSIPDGYVGTEPNELLKKYKMRSIFVVNSTHLTEFFKKF